MVMVGHQNHPNAQPQWGAPAHGGGGGGGKALPIAIGAGLAVGVFLGLLLIRGTGKGEAQAETAEVAEAAAPDAGAVAQAIDAAAPVAAKTPDAAPAVPVAKKVTVTFAVTPADVRNLAITVDGDAIEGSQFATELAPDVKKKTIAIKVKAKGHRTYREKVEITADKTVEITLKPKRRGGSSNHGGNTERPPGGLIDL